MNTFSIATWNVNSLRVRLPQLAEWLTAVQPDVVALQETKLPDADFPAAEIQALGYQVTYSGQRTYNGVAVLSRTRLTPIATDIPGFVDEQRRVLAVETQGCIVVDLYVPNGQEPGSDKYVYKLRWLEALRGWLVELHKLGRPLIVLGDFNIAQRIVTCTTRSPGKAACTSVNRSDTPLRSYSRPGWSMSSVASSRRRRPTAGGTIARPHSVAITACASISFWLRNRWWSGVRPAGSIASHAVPNDPQTIRR